MRWVIGALGIAISAWGAYLLLPLIDVNLALWFIGGPVVHDVLLAPLFGGLGLLISRWVPEPWRAPVQVGGVLTGVLVLLAVPLLWRPFAGPANPGLNDRDHLVGLLVAVVVSWLGVLTANLIGRALRRRHPRV
ncbi:hypothetical protein ALI22I_26605 [Saccharothrix sp. ALI-22-I]|uniref:hypothetical protein n=1 Tax=Saccharothrix sp. ALI-22-I TaxID=1933778 RepID=UPI00097BC0F3|nr:hypothetical protein [Saccharothrix sp. ALI-22-I]ONI86258.1 hypothetical protein ALI22I_26605 [Saccharothrix sp. ALI-22-I]